MSKSQSIRNSGDAYVISTKVEICWHFRKRLGVAHKADFEKKFVKKCHFGQKTRLFKMRLRIDNL